MMAFVFGVIAASIFAGSMHLVLGSQSTNTAVAPAIQIASAVAKNVFGCVMTSSPGPMPIAINASQIASVPLPDADGVRHPVKRGQLLFELLEHRALHVLAALDHALQVRVYLRLECSCIAARVRKSRLASSPAWSPPSSKNQNRQFTSVRR